MLSKKVKSSVLALAVFLLSLTAATALAPSNAYAAQPINAGVVSTCLESGNGLAVRIVGCVKDKLINAATQVADSMYSEVSLAIEAMGILAVIIAGIAVAGGHTPVWQGPLMTTIKIVFVTAVASNIGSYISVVFDAMSDLIDIVTVIPAASCAAGLPSSGSPSDGVWKVIDCELDMIMGGVNGPLKLSDGLVGFLLRSLLSGGIGAFIAIMGAVLIFYFLYTLMQALFIFITAYVAMALVAMVGPIFIPLILFSSTKRYFDSWLGMLFSFFLQPVALFAYLSVLLTAFDQLIFTGDQSLYSVITGNSASSTTTIGEYIKSKGAYQEVSLSHTAVNVDSLGTSKDKKSPKTKNVGEEGRIVTYDPCTTPTTSTASGQIASNIDCLATKYVFDKELARDVSSYFKVDQPVTVVNWDKLSGSAGQEYVLNVALAFFSAAITAYILYSLLNHLPYIGAGISGGGGDGVPVFGKGTLEPTNNLIAKSLKGAIGGGVM